MTSSSREINEESIEVEEKDDKIDSRDYASRISIIDVFSMISRSILLKFEYLL